MKAYNELRVWANKEVQSPITTNPMAKYRFKEAFKDAEISIPYFRGIINKKTLTDEIVEIIFKKFPQFKHNFELVPEKPEKEDKVVPAKVPAKGGKRR